MTVLKEEKYYKSRIFNIKEIHYKNMKVKNIRVIY